MRVDGFYLRQVSYTPFAFQSSSMVEHAAVNRGVVSSSLTCGAKEFKLRLFFSKNLSNTVKKLVIVFSCKRSVRNKQNL